MDLGELFGAVVGDAGVTTGDSVSEDYGHDEALTAAWQRPAAVVRPASTEEVARVLALANEHRIPVTARGSGTGLSGACVPQPDGIVVSFERMTSPVGSTASTPST